MKIDVKMYDQHKGVDRDLGRFDINDLQELMDTLKHWGVNNEDDQDLDMTEYFGQFKLQATGPAYFEITTV